MTAAAPRPSRASTLAELGLGHLRVGLLGLLLFLSLGVLLETFHGFKVGAYLDVAHEGRRLSLRLAHAHGTLLSVLQVVFALTLASRYAPPRSVAARAGKYLNAATLLVPGGFLLGGVFARDGDPGAGVLLVPLGALLLFLAIFVTLRGAGMLELRDIVFDTREYDASVRLRARVLREPLGLRVGPEERDEEATLIHLGAFEGDQLVGCLMLHDVGNGAVRMRQVAIEPERQRSGIGTKLVHYSEQVARERGFTEMVLHARDTAIAFYARLGYELRGEPFIEVTVPHRTMVKPLAPRPSG